MDKDHYCVMGNPVAHSRSPWIHARFAELTGQTLLYDKREIPLDGFGAGLRAFIQEGGRGCDITVPFKFQAASLATRLSQRAVLAKASNTLTFDGECILADNTDGIGLVHDIEQGAGQALQGLHILLIGAGGAAAGVLGSLLDTQPAHISIANRTLQKATDLVVRHQSLASLHKTKLSAHSLQGLEGNFDVIINATSSSLQGDDVPVDARVLKPGALAYDMMYGQSVKGFMAWAQHHGARPRDGLGMLVEQAAESFFIWRGCRPPAAQVLSELRQWVG